MAIYDFETKEQRRLTNKGSWEAGPGEPGGSVFSPDGRLVAYSWRVKADENWHYDLRLVAAHDADAEPRIVYSNPEFYYIEPSGWSPSGEILISGTRDDGSTAIGFVAVETGEFQAVKTLQWTPPRLSLSPDGRWIGYDVPSTTHQPRRDIYLLAADGSRETLLTGHRANDVVLDFTSGSDVLLFASNRTGSYGLWAAAISSEGVPDEPRLLQRDIGSVEPLGVTRDGSLFYARAIGARDVYTAEVDLATGRLLSQPALVEGLHQGVQGVWSPDGRTLAYLATPGSVGGYGDEVRVILRSWPEGREREIAPDIWVNPWRMISWSPDGERLMIASMSARGARNGIYALDVESGETALLVREPTDQRVGLRTVGWGADGQTFLYRMVYELAEDGETEHAFYRVDPGASEGKRIHVSKRDKIVLSVLSPDRDEIAYRVLGPNRRVEIISVEGGTPRTVWKPDGKSVDRGFSWTPDGKALLLLRHVGWGQEDSKDNAYVELWVVPTDGSAPRKTELTSKGFYALSVHPDEKTVVYTEGSPDFRIWKMQNYIAAEPNSMSE